MTLDQADSIPLAYQLPDTVVFEAGNIRARIEPRVLTRADIFVLQMIKDNPGRPVYFSRTAGSYGRELGLDAYLLTQGLARAASSIMCRRIGRDTMLVPGEGFVDVARSTALWNDVFRGKDAFVSKDGWVDKPSVGIPALYVNTGFMLYDILQNSGDAAGAQKALDDAKRIAQGARIAEFFNFAAAEPSPLEIPGDVRPAVPMPLAPKESGAKRSRGSHVPMTVGSREAGAHCRFPDLASLLHPQRFHGMDPCGPTCRERAGRQSNDRKQQGNTDEGDGVGRADAVDQ